MLDKRARADVERLDREFVSSIVDELRKPPSKLAYPESKVRSKLSEAITALRVCFLIKGEKEWFSKENRQYAIKLLRAVNRLKKLISAAPDNFFLPDELKKLTPRTSGLTDLCFYIIDKGGTSKRDYLKEMAASCALDAIKTFSNQVPSAGDADSTLCVIASRLFEAATGQSEPNLQRSCKYVLREYRQEKPSGWFDDSILKFSVLARMHLERFADAEGLDKELVSSIVDKLREPPSMLMRAVQSKKSRQISP
jgi:hypothetical protein